MTQRKRRIVGDRRDDALDPGRTRAASEAAGALRARQAQRDLIDHIERSERRLNQAVQELSR